MNNYNEVPAVGPDFMIIGAMKCATSTLHDQLSRQSGFFMSTPKEPNFFSDDEVFSRGLQWYNDLFVDAGPGQLRGESSTHYTKLPCHPKTLERITSCCPVKKFIYVIRHPVERLVSHYVHEWTQGLVSCSIDKALKDFPELIDYGCYNMQIEPYLNAFGKNAVLPMFSERLRQDPLREMQIIFKFLNVNAEPVWHKDLQSNVSTERMRVSPWRDAVVDNRLVQLFRRCLVPKTVRDRIRQFWTMKEKPQLSPSSLRYVENIFDQDLNLLGEKLGFKLTCHNFKDVVTERKEISWTS